MPTLRLRSYSSVLALLATALPIHAQDLHIKKNISSGGYVVSSTDTSIKGARERIVSQSASGNTITLRQCDLKRTITVNEQAQTYYVAADPQDEAAVKAAAFMNAGASAAPSAAIIETAAVVDTGERKTLYGFTARHLKTTVSVESSKGACTQVSQKYTLDGWYADLSKEQSAACQQVLPPVHQSEGCNDPVIRRRSGSAKSGYPLAETVHLANADGTFTEITVRATEISKPNLESSLFDVPVGYHEVKTQAELSGPAMQQQAAMPQPAAFAQSAQATTGGAAARPSMAQMMNPGAQIAMQQQMMAQAQQMGMQNPGMSAQPGGAAVGIPQALGPKAPGKIRIGIAPPDAQLGQGNNASADYSTPIRNAVVALMSGPAVEIAALDSHIAMQLQAEAQQKQCDYVLFSGVTVKHGQSSGFGKFMKMGSMAASMTPMGAMTHSMGTAMAAQAAGMAASQMAQQQAMSQLAGFNGQIKSKDDVSVQYQLVQTGQTSPVLQNTLQGKAKSDGEDVLTPLLQQTATAVLTQVSHK